MMRRAVLLIPVALVVLAWPADGDTVVFESGDRLEGRLVELSRRRVTFRSEIAGRIDAARHRMSRLSVPDDGRRWELIIADGRVLRGSLRKMSRGRVSFEPADGEVMRVELTRVESLVPEPGDEAKPEQGRVYLDNGDRVTGDIAQLKGSNLSVNVAAGGTLTVDMSRVRTFSTSQPARLYLDSGTSTEARVRTAGSGRIRIADGALADGQVVQLSELTGINVQPDRQPEWKGSMSAGYTATQGNTNTQSSNLKVRLRKRWESARAKFRTRYNRAAQESQRTGEDILTEQELTSRGQYDYFFTENRYAYGSLRYRRDEVANLDTRLTMSGGGGYQWIETERFLFSTEAGLGVNYEDYSNPSRTTSDASAEASYEVEAALNDRLTLLHDWTISPSIGELSDYYVTSSAELRASLTEAVFTSVEVALEYDADPAPGTPKTDITYTLGGGVEF